MIRLVAVGLSLGLMSGVAHADDDPPLGPVPGFGTTDRTHVADRFGLAIGYTRTQATQKGPPPGTFSATGAYRFELYGQRLTASGFGGYASAPMLWWRNGDDSETAVSNPELGALWVPKNFRVPLVARLGVSLDGSRSNRALAHVFASHSRTTDTINATANVTAARLSASILPRVEGGFLRVDAGVDIPVIEGDGVDAHALGRFNAAVGTETQEMAFYAEVANLIDLQAGDGERFRHTFGFGLRFILWKIQPSLTISFPVDAETRKYVTLMTVFGFEYVPSAPPRD